MNGTLRKLFHYPIKGLRAQPLSQVNLQPAQGFPHDRVYGFARPNSGFDPSNPKPLPKTKFIMLARDAALALLDTHLDIDTRHLTIRGRDQSGTFDITNEDGRAQAAAFLSDELDLPADQRPTLHAAAPHRFTDVSVVSPQMMNTVSLINLDSVADFADRIGRSVDPNRFRGNILFSGLPAFSELDLVDQILRIGPVEMKVVLRTKRCPATQVNLLTGTRDLDTPKLLHQHYGHSDMGVYAEVLSGGTIRPGDALQVVG